MEYIENFVKHFATFMWGPITIFFILGVGLYLTVLFGFFQFTHCKDIFKNTLGSLLKKKDGDEKGVSAFEAVSTALAGSLGTGNIIGVATAMFSGGPGAIFWLWVSALLGTILKFSEVVLSLKFRVLMPDGYLGGPMYVMEKGLKSKVLGKLFAVFCIFASFGIGSTTQANSAVLALEKGFGSPKWLSVTLILIVFVVVIVGGIKRIGVIAAKIVPLMSMIYIAFSLYIIFKNANLVPASFKLIFDGAFNFKAAAGGEAGYLVNLAMQYGMARSVFISEAGLGSSPIAHAASNTKSPIKQGQWGIIEVFFNTIVMCTMTSLVILVTGALNVSDSAGDVTMVAFSKELGPLANVVLAVSLALFGFTTTMSWAYYGEQSIKYCFGKKYVLPYMLIYIVSIGFGGMCAMSLVWQMADVFNAFMAIPNLISLLVLSPMLFRIVRDYKKELKQPIISKNID